MSDEKTVDEAVGAAPEAAQAVGEDATRPAAPDNAAQDAAPEAATEREAAPEPEEPAVPEVTKHRQWVTLRGTSMDLRAGASIAGEIAHDLASAVGRPHACLLAHVASAPADLVEGLRRDLTDKGFFVHMAELPEGDAAHGVEALSTVYAPLREAGITADDLVVAVGDGAALSLAGAACMHWCGQTMIAQVPLSYTAALAASTTPRALDVAGAERMVAFDGYARFEICDIDVLDARRDEEDVLMARALMVATAMADSDKAFGKLWDAADAILAGDRNAIVDQMVETIRGRGKIVSSSSVAIRQSIGYGESLRHALRGIVAADVPDSTLLAESLRFAARLSVAGENLSIDDMFTQDELLERLGLGTVACPVDADDLLEALRRERFARTNRFMLALPRAIGRVRLTAVEAETLEEHVKAWCSSR